MGAVRGCTVLDKWERRAWVEYLVRGEPTVQDREVVSEGGKVDVVKGAYRNSFVILAHRF